MIKHVLLAFSGAIIGACLSAPATGEDAADLIDIITARDTAMFEAFNTCDGKAFRTFLTDDMEFYHDDDGVLDGPDTLANAVDTSICGNFTRQLVADSLEVWPIPGFGAIQTGVHTFTNVGAVDPHGKGRFLLVWKQTEGGWKVARIVSYDHGPFEKINSADAAD